MDVCKDKEYTEVFEIDLHGLMYGKYTATFVFSYTLIEGRSELIEAIMEAVNFEVVKKDDDMYWSSQYWGYYKSDQIKHIESFN